MGLFGALPHELSFPARRGSSDTQGQVVARELDDRPFLIRVIPIRERAALHMKSEGCTRRIDRIRAEMSQRPRGYALVLLGRSLKSSGREFNTRSACELRRIMTRAVEYENALLVAAKAL